MPEPTSATSTNIHKKYNKQEQEILCLRKLMRSNTLCGRVLRVLFERLKSSISAIPYTDEQIEVLLMVMNAAEWRP